MVSNNPTLYTIIVIIFSYLIGSISPSILLGRLKGIDIRKEGSGNAGTTNTLRVLGKKAALITLLVDILKGTICVLLFSGIGGEPKYGYIACIFVFLGHIFPIYFSFKGGKGVATAFGAVLGVNWILAMISILFVAVVVLISRRMSVGSISVAVLAVIITPFLEPGFEPYIILMAIIIIIKHKGNIRRIIDHEEPYLEFPKKNNKKEV